MTDLLSLIKSGAAADPAQLRGLGGAWRTAEQAIHASFAADPRRAGRDVKSFARLAAASGENEARGRAARLAGSYAWYRGENAESLRHYRVAERLLEGAALDGVRLGLAVALSRLGRFAEAVTSCRRARRSARRRGDRLIEAGAVFNEALAHRDAGRVAVAAKLYGQARTAFAAAGNDHHAALAAENLANTLILLDRHDEAERLFAEAEETFRRAGAVHEAARVRYNHGTLLVALDRLGDAESELAAAERDLSHAGDALVASHARLDRGEALLRAGLVAEASRLLDSAARGLARGAAASEIFRAATLRARAAIARGEFAEARKILGRARTPTTRAWDADRAELEGLALAGERRWREARSTLERAAAAFGRDRPGARARATCAAGWCAVEEHDLDGARRLARSAGRLVSRLPVPSLRFGAWALLFVVEDEAGRRTAASSALRRALASLERSREGLGSDPMRSAVLRGRERWFARAVRHLLDGPRGAERALALVEQWRARALVDLVTSSARLEVRGGRLSKLRARVALLERQLERGAGPALLRAGTAEPPATVARSLAAAERRLHEETSRELRAGTAPDFSVERLRDAAAPGTAVVSLFCDERGGVAFVVRGGEVRAVTLGVSDVEVRRLVEELHFRLGKFALGPEFVASHARRLAAETDRVLEEISDCTLGPIAELLRGADRVVVAPHGAWHEVPFAALPYAGARLVDAMAVSMTPSCAALGASVAATGRPLVLAYADPRAPRVADEGRAVASVAKDALLLEGEAATSAALRTASPPRFVHVASHGRFRADLPGASGVQLADGWLRAADFHALELEGALVVLSGCQTGLSQVDPGGEVQGLVRGVMSSGARELVVSLWRVDDAATARLMSRFHELREGGEPVDGALASAQREAAASGLHPWYWAAFTVWTRRP